MTCPHFLNFLLQLPIENFIKVVERKPKPGTNSDSESHCETLVRMYNSHVTVSQSQVFACIPIPPKYFPAKVFPEIPFP